MVADTTDASRTLRPYPTNLRDLGGTPTRRGTKIRPRRLLRSDDLAAVQPGAVPALLRDIGLVVDLRSDEEERLFGVATMPVSTERLRTPVEFGTIPTHAMVATDPTAFPDTPEQLGAAYADGIRRSAPALRGALERIAEEPQGTLVHCVAGKDRTGILVALLLTAVDVPRRFIVDDYAATAANMPALLATASGLLGQQRPGTEPPSSGDEHPRRNGADLRSLAALLPSVLLDAPAAAMRTCLEELDESHGSPLGPLRDAGMDASVEVALRSSLVQDGR